MDFDTVTFTDANGKEVAYDGSPVTWRVSVYALMVKNRKILLVKNRHETMFDLPGGGLAMNEEISVALKREVMEEAGAQVQLEQPVTFHQDYFFHKGKFFRTLLLFFTAKLIGASGTQSDPNMEPAGYYSREEIENLPMLGYVKNVIRDHFEK